MVTFREEKRSVTNEKKVVTKSKKMVKMKQARARDFVLKPLYSDISI